MKNGHVFVVRGALESIDADVVVIPTDADFRVEPRWDAVWGAARKNRPAKPPGWRQSSSGPVIDPAGPDVPALWFIDAAVNNQETQEQALDKILAGVTKAIAACTLLKPARRSRPLIALPTLGVGGGGLTHRRGELIARLLATTRKAAKTSGVDVVIVAHQAADHAAFQHVRRTTRFLSRDLDATARTLAAKAVRGELALFIGAGVSMSAGLPSWDDLLRTLTAGNADFSADGLNPLDVAELISRDIGDFDAAIRQALDKPQRAGISHLLLAGLGCEEAVTTNFDMLYERAASADGRELAVLPWDSLTTRRPWLLKLHGDVEHRKSITLSRGDFIRYGRDHGPAGAILQSLLLSRHLLVVGASLTDDNFLRLAYEVHDYVKKRQSSPRTLGTVLSLEPQPVKAKLFTGIFDYVNTSTDRGKDNRQGRALAIFLDALGMYASVDSSFLLDKRYSYLLDAADNALAADVTDLLARIDGRNLAGDEHWARLAASLRTFGARPP